MSPRHPERMRRARSGAADDPAMWSATGTRLRGRPLWLLSELLGLAREWISRFFAVQAFDRAMSICAYAYAGLFPLLIVMAAVRPRAEQEDFAQVLIDEFHLTGAAAQTVQLAFAPIGNVQSSVTALGLVLLLYSALSFSRGLQRLYEGAFGLPTLGMRNTPRAMLWLAFIGLVFSVRPLVTGPVSGPPRVALTLAIGVGVWLVTPYLLLGRRVAWRHLLPSAVLTGIGMAGVGIWSVLWMPRTFAASAQQFGIIGIGFALIGWLFAASVVVVVATTGGAMVADRLDKRRGPP
jgi:membrane protein